MNITEGIEIKLSKEKSEEFFYNALCNGLSYFQQYGISLYEGKNYNKAKKTLAEKGDTNQCYENILMEMLRNGDALNFIDQQGEYSRKVTMEMVHKNVQKTPFIHLSNMISENDDAETADCIIQSVLYDGEIIFG